MNVPGRPRFAPLWRLPAWTGAGALDDGPTRVSAAYLGRLAGFGAAVVLAIVLAAFTFATWRPHLFPIDALAYWLAWHGPSVYTPGAQVWDTALFYSPAFAQALWPLAILPWPAFAVLWSAVGFAAYAWLLAPVNRPTRVILLVAVILGPLAAGNIEWLLALAAVGMVTRPAWAAVPLLTKVTPGVAALWYVGRRDWRAVGLTAAATAAIVAASFALAPGLWPDWLALLAHNAQHGRTGVASLVVPVPSLMPRLLVAGALAVWGGWRSDRWTIPVAMLLAQPDLNLATVGLLAAVPRLGELRPDDVPQPVELGRSKP